MARGGGSSGNKRQRTMDDDDKGGPSKVQLKGLSWNSSAAQPSFLKNAYSALSGNSTPRGDESGRPAIPTRPEGEGGDESEEDEWDLARGDEAPEVVVLKEGKHLGKEEVERLRAEAKSSGLPDPSLTSSQPTPASKSTGSLSFSTNTTSSSRKNASTLPPPKDESWEEVIARSKVHKEEKEKERLKEEEEKLKSEEKKKREKKKEKKKNEKKIGLLSFDE